MIAKDSKETSNKVEFRINRVRINRGQLVVDFKVVSICSNFHQWLPTRPSLFQIVLIFGAVFFRSTVRLFAMKLNRKYHEQSQEQLKCPREGAGRGAGRGSQETWNLMDCIQYLTFFDISLKCLFECTGSSQSYEMSGRCNHLPSLNCTALFLRRCIHNAHTNNNRFLTF